MELLLIGGDRITHRLDHPRRPFQHDVHIKPKTHLADIIKDPTITVVSWHHQAVKNISPAWRVSAQADDGLIEAIEHQEHPWMLGVQWHPEMSPQWAPHPRLFQALVDAGQARKPLYQRV
ncbi:gamma-glutamyl-gamma-aminobutyrate hydrolase family protein [Leptolyngbya sp. FACHB-541]|uniref:gamma-glutamyl-gamma-aminobutyrate hydrolase family protein n=1 Tax=Leptolyngbya sp. FACHB-541 TaxID=2692810 RepID=UPI0016831563|nr:gamma-glutamyl-gamma-aminobutyrate hydrolase family protein [Leptolyngbya sp. FACHB-541]MBD2000952.1 gamma-glutamyl-gamma-aminobutyrate hydrolase family protein [Leptolyngbya sp. FACHB-541]